MTSGDFRRVGAEVSNWGRWGAEDERGTTNLITPREIVGAARLVRKGAVFDLGIPLGADGPQAFPGRTNPLHMMTETGAGQEYPGGAKWSDDYVVMPLQSGTQWDAFAHVWYDGRSTTGSARTRSARTARRGARSTPSAAGSPGGASCSTSPGTPVSTGWRAAT
ncbi:hypothetical protein ACFQY7_22840 [Actinomadura luteofluorescens]|uniref:hypothetical protein n=1 Tax=Actinomadura luteofluorescens TaxID=46163 RepID=UPI00362C1ACD